MGGTLEAVDRRPYTLDPDAPDPRSRRQDRWRAAGAVTGGVIGLTLIVAPWIRLPYVSLAPGQTADVTRRIEITSGGPTYDTTGRLLLATVGLRRRITAPQLLRGWLDDAVDVKRERDVFGSESPKESQERSRVQMDDSKLVATVAALRAIGRAPRGDGVRVKAIEPGFPADSVLRVDDVIVRANGRPLCLAEDLGAAVRAARRDDAVRLEVRRGTDGPIRSVEIVPRWNDQFDFGVLGVGAETVQCRTGLSVEIDTGLIGGPSGGLAMALGIVDRLTPGELTGGAVVAATGTIGADGRVGVVGGVKQKTIAVRSAGAKLFLVPRGEEAEARRHAGSMRVVPVATVGDALSALRRGASPGAGG
jgi:PDZ domain-containing protein